MTFKREANLRNHKRNFHEIVVDFKGQKGNNKSKPKSKKAVISNEVSTENIDVVESSGPIKEKTKILKLMIQKLWKMFKISVICSHN